MDSRSEVVENTSRDVIPGGRPRGRREVQGHEVDDGPSMTWGFRGDRTHRVTRVGGTVREQDGRK